MNTTRVLLGRLWPAFVLIAIGVSGMWTFVSANSAAADGPTPGAVDTAEETTAQEVISPVRDERPGTTVDSGDIIVEPNLDDGGENLIAPAPEEGDAVVAPEQQAAGQDLIAPATRGTNGDSSSLSYAWLLVVIFGGVIGAGAFAWWKRWRSGMIP